MLEITRLTKTFNPGTPNEVRALRDVSLRLERGSFLLIIGTNGSGKSTLLNAVAGTFLAGLRLFDSSRAKISLAGPNTAEARLIGRVFPKPLQRHGANHVHRRKSLHGGPPWTSARFWVGRSTVNCARRYATASVRSTWVSRIGSTTQSGVCRVDSGKLDAADGFMAQAGTSAA
jgi:energy-coupling factor transporter ATP-binding protein EcfA2